jgi:hypothetical protein
MYILALMTSCNQRQKHWKSCSKTSILVTRKGVSVFSGYRMPSKQLHNVDLALTLTNGWHVLAQKCHLPAPNTQLVNQYFLVPCHYIEESSMFWLTDSFHHLNLQNFWNSGMPSSKTDQQTKWE